jgi:hypothetical protein
MNVRTYKNSVFFDPKMEVRGQWKSSNIGGGLDYPTWRSNPQIILDVGESAEVTITMKLEKVESEPKDSKEESKETFGFVVLKKAPAGTRKLLPFPTVTDNKIVVSVVDSTGDLNLMHNATGKKGQSEGIIFLYDNSPSSSVPLGSFA